MIRIRRHGDGACGITIYEGTTALLWTGGKWSWWRQQWKKGPR